MTALDDWFATVDDVQQVNARIALLEQQRNRLLSNGNDNGNDDRKNEDNDAKVADLANSIEMAVRNDDNATLDALMVTYGQIDALVAACELVTHRRTLMALRNQMSVYEDLKAQLSIAHDYDFDQLKEVKTGVHGLTHTEAQLDLLSRIDTIVLSYKNQFSAELLESLHGSKWLKSEASLPEMTMAFTQLVNLQSLLSNSPVYPEPLWAFTVLSQSFKVSFDYHFNTEKQTNRIDKPELFFKYLLNYLSSHITRINSLFSLKDTEFSDRFTYTEFITSALVPVRDKLEQFIHVIRKNTFEGSSDVDLRLLIHLIKETVTFDDAIVNEFFYDPSNDGLWPGLMIMFEYADLEKWLNLEIKLSHSNFITIVDAQNVFQIDYTSVGDDELKPTVSAIKLKYLFESTTSTFQRLFIPNYENSIALQKFKLKLFSKTFLRFLEMYYERLNEGAIAFAELFRKTRSLLHSSKALSDDVDISGTNGLDRLFRLYCSLNYTIQSIKIWNLELIFVELNSLYNKYSNTKSTTLFKSILEDYTKLEQKVFELILQFYSKTIDSLLKSYVNLNNWSRARQQHQYNVSNELVPLLETVQELLVFSSNIGSKFDTNKLKNFVSLKIANHLFQYVIKGNHFSPSGLKQLTLDFTTIWERLKLKRNFPAYHKLVEAFKVMTITDDEVSSYGPFTKVSLFARSGEFTMLKHDLDLRYLQDGDLLDILLRIS